MVSTGSPDRADEAVRTLLGAGVQVEGVDFEGSTPTGARVVGPLDQVVGHLAYATRMILAQLSSRPHPLAHGGPDRRAPRRGPGACQALAALLSRSPAAAAVHGVAGAHVVVAVSQTFLDAAATTAGLHPRRQAYAKLPGIDADEPCWFAVAGRAQAPDPPPAPAAPDGPHVTAGDHSAVVGAPCWSTAGRS